LRVVKKVVQRKGGLIVVKDLHHPLHCYLSVIGAGLDELAAPNFAALVRVHTHDGHTCHRLKFFDLQTANAAYIQKDIFQAPK